MMINRSILREFPLLAVVLEAAAAMLLALAVLVLIAVVMYRTGDIMMTVPVTFAIGDYLSLPYELTTLVPTLKDGALPTPSL